MPRSGRLLLIDGPKVTTMMMAMTGHVRPMYTGTPPSVATFRPGLGWLGWMVGSWASGMPPSLCQEDARRSWRRVVLWRRRCGRALLWTAAGCQRPRLQCAAMVAALSPSRASDFMQCPLLYRFRVIDKLPQAPSAAAARGTLVHSVLERRLRPACGRPHGRRGRRDGRAAVGGACSRPSPSSASWSTATTPRRWPSGSRTRRRWSSAGSASRTRPGSSRPSASSTSRPTSTG